MGNGNGVYIATESFTSEIDGEHYAVIKGKTRVREGHPLLDANPDYFKPVGDDVTYDTIERATAAPGERRRRPAKAGRKDSGRKDSGRKDGASEDAGRKDGSDEDGGSEDGGE